MGQNDASDSKNIGGFSDPLVIFIIAAAVVLPIFIGFKYIEINQSLADTFGGILIAISFALLGTFAAALILKGMYKIRPGDEYTINIYKLGRLHVRDHEWWKYIFFGLLVSLLIFLLPFKPTSFPSLTHWRITAVVFLLSGSFGAAMFFFLPAIFKKVFRVEDVNREIDEELERMKKESEEWNKWPDN